ncbi:mechanosensitive ion channel protein 6-like [Actinidia eriantha]|uniref:mechanosensitive ion channel protein 6-like n=1 Tax=Actinidia eriantha TaxID=165200 RepID=UPI00258374C5|nr:mechanosensitive ion channel protein 6-like [Actinidia eriantha]XP_057490032.1 mechanosensitive ion channel protein 6-like [Actinidia eriantha]XP_057490033.1 mechanosensitive ion channel protein 6-like [Actinidia eriantha]
MDKLRKSFKSFADQTHQNQSTEERYVLLHQQQDDPMAQREVVVKINGQNSPRETELSSPSPSPSNTNDVSTNRVWRDSSYDFSNDKTAKVVSEFDFAADSPPLSKIDESPSYGQFTPREARVSFTEATVHRRSSASTAAAGCGGDEVVVCSSNSSFGRKSTLMREKTKSRLMDPPDADHRSRVLKSGRLGKASESDEDDPFLEEDLPLEYKSMKFNAFSVLQLGSLILIIATLACTLAFPRFRRKTLFELELWKWELMVLVLISGRLVSGWAIRIGVFFIEQNFLLRKRVLYFVYGVRNAVQNCVWLGLVLIAWQCIFDKRVERLTNGKVLHMVTKIWICLLVGTIIWLLKTLLVKVLASSFHVSTFFDRIQDSLFNQYVIETLSGHPWIEIQQEQEEEEKIIAEVEKLQNAGANVPAELRANVFARREKVIGSGRHQRSPKSAKGTPRFATPTVSQKLDEGITIDHLHRLNQKNVSAWNMKKLMNTVRRGVISTLDEQIQDSTGEDESAVEITSENQAKAAARKIFYNVAKPGSKYIHIEDLMRFLREDEALKTMRLFEGAREGKGISKRALKNWVVNAIRERRVLALSLNDTKTAVNKLHQMLNVAIGVVLLVIWLLILKITSTHFFVFLGSQLLLVAFMFGNTCKTTFEAIIFLFVMHPFDVGDRCEVDGVQMVVEEMNILTTIFLRFDNQKIIYPNSVLATKPISNYYRSPDMGDAIDFCIHIATPMEKIAMMKERIIRYIDNKSDHWHPAPMIVLRDVEDMNRLKISLWLSHRMNHQDMGERWARRALLVEEMIKIFRELDIEYRMLPLDVNVRNMPAITSTRLPSNWNTIVN